VAGTAAGRRYAKALFQLAEESGRVSEVRGELAALAEQLAAHGALADALLRPLYPVAERRSVLSAVADRLGASALIKSFFSLLIDQRRLIQFDAICAEYGRLADERAGLTRATVRAAGELSDEQRERLRRALSARLGREVELAVEVDPSLLGGLVAQVGDVVYDGSLRTQLRQLREGLARD
jgi:F-type H+-transporting ATPase subunit delta